MRSRVFFGLLGVGLLAAASVPAVQAGTVLVFGQRSTSSDFTATVNGNTGAMGGTTLSAVNVEVTITAIANVAPLPGSFPEAYLNLSAVSVSNATVNGTNQITEDFSGSFSITSLAGGGGTNYLSGTFSDAVFGSGTGLVLTASGPAGVPTLSSSVIGTLAQDRAISLSFTDVEPPALITSNSTLGPFSSSVSGSFSAQAPEPSSLIISGVGMAGLFLYRRCLRRRRPKRG
jgi:PEP-CTERM motif